MHSACAAPKIAMDWVRSRAALRLITAAHCKCHPAQLRFDSGQFGKPKLVSHHSPRAPFHFNLSRSGDLCLIATCLDQPVGIDVERISAEGGEEESPRGSSPGGKRRRSAN